MSLRQWIFPHSTAPPFSLFCPLFFEIIFFFSGFAAVICMTLHFPLALGPPARRAPTTFEHFVFFPIFLSVLFRWCPLTTWDFFSWNRWTDVSFLSGSRFDPLSSKVFFFFLVVVFPKSVPLPSCPLFFSPPVFCRYQFVLPPDLTGVCGSFS